MSDLFAELMGTECRCGRIKHSKQTFCARCYRALPRSMQMALYRHMGLGYEEAYAAAVRELKGGDAGAGQDNFEDFPDGGYPV